MLPPSTAKGASWNLEKRREKDGGAERSAIENKKKKKEA